MTNNTWQITPIGEQIELLTDYTANGSFAGLKQNVQYYNQLNYAALVRTTDLEKKFFAPERFTDKRGYEFLKKSSLFGGEIVLANVGSIGKVYRVPKYHLPMTLAPNMYLIRFKKEIDKNYAFQYLTSQIFQKKLLSNVASTTLSAINKSNLRSITIPVPPLGVQKKIGDILSSTDEAIQKTDLIIQKSEELKNGLMSELLTKGIGHKKFKKTKLGEIPEEWELKQLDSIAKIIDSLHLTPKYSIEGFPMVRVLDVKQGELDLSNCSQVSEEVYMQFTKNHTPQQGDIVISRVGSFGVFSYVASSTKFCLGQNTSIISPLINSKYLYYALQSPIASEQVSTQVVGSNQKTLSLKHIRNLFIPVPPESEQHQITDILNNLDSNIEMEKRELVKLHALKTGLMHDIFNQKVQIN